MSRTYFPTRNENGVRDLAKSVQLGYYYDDHRGPAEPAPKGAMNPVTLGAVVPTPLYPVDPWQRFPRVLQPIRTNPVCDHAMPMPDPITGATPQWVSTASAANPCAGYWNWPAPPVTQQSSPTPRVLSPGGSPGSGPPTSGPIVMVTSGGGTISPAPAASSSALAPSPQTSTVVTAAPALTDQVATWLGGTTPIWSWNVPNALLTAAVVLAGAALMGGGKKR